MKNNKTKHVLQLALVLIVGLLIGLFMRINLHTNIPLLTNGGKLNTMFDGVYSIIEENWVNTSEEDVDLQTAAISGFLNQLPDPHTTYFSQEDLETFTSTVDGSFAGIGVTFSMKQAGGYISSVMQETPASEAGLEPGDLIIEVDGTSIEGMTASEVKELVGGKEGTNVEIGILRNNVKKYFSITRRRIDSSVTYEIREDKIGYLDINTFGTMTDQSIEKALQYFKSKHIDTLIIDLRDNTGGYLSSVQNVLGLFLKKDTLLFSIQEKTGPAIEYKSLNDTPYLFKQGYILINNNTASASEVMAGALSEQLDYTLVGKTTYGKGTAQTTMMLTDLTSIKYTYAKWLLPSGKCINGVGLEPDVKIDEMELSDYFIINFDEPKTIEFDIVSGDVANMQMMLETIGYNPIRTDGYFDRNTETLLQQFEADHDLTVDGKLSKQDYLELEEALVSYYSDLKHDQWYQYILDEMR